MIIFLAYREDGVITFWSEKDLVGVSTIEIDSEDIDLQDLSSYRVIDGRIKKDLAFKNESEQERDYSLRYDRAIQIIQQNLAATLIDSMSNEEDIKALAVLLPEEHPKMVQMRKGGVLYEKGSDNSDNTNN